MNDLLKKIGEDRKLQQTLMLAAAVKISVLILIFISYTSFPFFEAQRDKNFVYPAGEPVTLASAYKTWDGTHYIFLAEQGYGQNMMSDAFYPLYPALISIFRYVFGSSLIAGIVLSNIFLLIAVAYLYLFVKERTCAKTAFASCVVLLAFPTSFFTGLVYSEALFIMLTLMLFYYLYKGSVAPALICGVLLPLARPQGILVAVPAAVYFIHRNVRAKRIFRIEKGQVVVLGFVLGFVSYLAWMRTAAGSWFAGFRAQQAFIADNSVMNIINIPSWFMKNFVDIDYTLHGFTTSIIDRLFFLGFLLALWFIHKKLDRTMFTYALVLGLVPALAGVFLAYTRYLLLVFPISIMLAMKLKRRYLFAVVPMAVLQFVFVVMHSLYFWVA